MKRRGLGVLALVGCLAWSAAARAQTTFASGSLIIPMDVDYQNAGTLRAYGLLYQLLHAGVPVSWCITAGKTLYTGTTAFPTAPTAVDFTASATDTRTAAVITNHGYRGGPFVIDSSVAAQAMPIVTAWTAANPSVAVHKATASFTATVSRYLVASPNIGINADGHECIAFGYMNAAGIPDSKGQAWPTACQASYPGYPDIMTPAQIAGPTTTSHCDGTLFDSSCIPVYCQLMSMHWDVTNRNEETVAEMHQFLSYPTHLFSECQAVNAIEDAQAGHFVATNNLTGEPTTSVKCGSTTVPNNGLCAAAQPTTLTLFRSDLPFAQFDGKFSTVGGSEPGYGLAPGSTYYSNGIVMMRNSTATDFGQDDLWMTGVAGGGCIIGGDRAGQCAGFGKVSYLGGHQYSTNLPILSNPQTQGTRLFLNSLFEAGCTTDEGQPTITFTKSAPATTSNPVVTFTINYSNAGPGVAVSAVITDALPAGAAFVSATGGGTFSGGVVTWKLGALGKNASGSVSVTVALSAYGTYDNTASLAYTVGTSSKSASSNMTATVYAPPPDLAVPVDLAGSLCAGVSCTPPANPCQQSVCNPSTGACVISSVGDGTACSTGSKCVVGQTCSGGTCGGGATVQCPPSGNPCQTVSCVPASGCVTSNVGNGTACSTGNACISAQTCQGGSCQGGMSVSCPMPLNPCEQSTCAPATGCGFAALSDGTACASGDACITGTTCTGGVCGGGTGITCPPPSQPCTVTTCSPSSGCGTAFAPAGTDPNSDCISLGACKSTCNGAGACAPACVGPGAPCTNNNQCSTGMCIANVCASANDLSAPPSDLSAAPNDMTTSSSDLTASSSDLTASSSDLTASSKDMTASDLSGMNGADLAGNGGTDLAGAGSTDLSGAGANDLSGGNGGRPGGASTGGCGCALGENDRGAPLPALFVVLAIAFALGRALRHDD